MSEWFKDWFASEYYLKVYSHRNESDAQNLLKLILDNIDIPINANILDAACGNGRHSLKFAQLGYNVIGFDLSKTLLKIAQKNKSTTEFKPIYLCSDIRTIPIKKSFNLILNLFTSFGYFKTDDENFLFVKYASNHLIKNGYFIFDYLNPNYIKNNLVKISIKKINNIKITEKRKIISNRVEKEIIISDAENLHRYFESVRLYSFDKIQSMFAKYGFKVAKSFGNYVGDIYNENTSERMIIIFKR